MSEQPTWKGLIAEQAERMRRNGQLGLAMTVDADGLLALAELVETMAEQLDQIGVFPRRDDEPEGHPLTAALAAEYQRGFDAGVDAAIRSQRG